MIASQVRLGQCDLSNWINCKRLSGARHNEISKVMASWMDETGNALLEPRQQQQQQAQGAHVPGQLLPLTQAERDSDAESHAQDNETKMMDSLKALTATDLRKKVHERLRRVGQAGRMTAHEQMEWDEQDCPTSIEDGPTIREYYDKKFSWTKYKSYPSWLSNRKYSGFFIDVPNTGYWTEHPDNPLCTVENNLRKRYAHRSILGFAAIEQVRAVFAVQAPQAHALVQAQQRQIGLVTLLARARLTQYLSFLRSEEAREITAQHVRVRVAKSLADAAAAAEEQRAAAQQAAQEARASLDAQEADFIAEMERLGIHREK
jgi:hypothetical protein